MKKTRKINWLNTIFLAATPIAGILGVVFLDVAWQTWVLAGVLSFLFGLMITAGYHRLFSHRSYTAIWPVRLFFAIFGSGAFEGSVMEWCTDHRVHHRYVDTEKDPYNINEGFWYAHIGWLIYLDPTTRDFSNVNDLSEDPILRFQDKYFVPLGILTGFIMPMLIASLWGNALAGLLVAGSLRIAFNHHMTFFINSLCHYMGKRTYTVEQTARDSWFTAIPTLGEGYHNFHHKFPIDYRNGIKLYHFDPTKWVIYLLSLVKATDNLKRVSDHKILQYRMRAEEMKMANKLPADSTLIEQTLAPLKKKIFVQIAKIEKLEQELTALRNQKLDQLHDKVGSYKAKLADYAKQLKAAQIELKNSISDWRGLLRTAN